MSLCTKSIKKWFSKFDVEELDSPDFEPIQWARSQELKRWLRPRPYHPTIVADLANALGVEWEQIPAAASQHFVGSFPRRVETVVAAY